MLKRKFSVIAIAISLCLLPALSMAEKEYDASAQALFNYGKELYKERKYADAQHEFSKCLMVNPSHQGAKEYLKLCQQETSPQSEEVATQARDDIMARAMENAQDKTTPAQKTPPPEKLTEETKTKEAPKEETVIAEEESLAPLADRGAWTLQKNQFYGELYSKFFWHRHQYDDQRKKRSWDYGGKGNEIREELKLQYGLTNDITLMLNTVAKEAHWKNDFDHYTKRGFAEIWPGVKYNLFMQPFIGTLQAKVKFPFEEYNPDHVPSLGTGKMDAEIRFLTAEPLPKLPGYTKAEIGFLGRQGKQANQIPMYFEFGYNPASWIVLKGALDVARGIPRHGQIAEDWAKYTIGPIFKIKDIIGIEFGFGNTFWGKNTSAGKELFCTISSQW